MTSLPGPHTQEVNRLAQRYLPGGVSGVLRAIEPPLVFAEANGAYLWDADGKRYLDYHLAFGATLLGHRHPLVQERVRATFERTDLIGIGASEPEARLAERICGHVPSAERVVFCNSGTEATYLALRLARAATGRSTIIKLQGGYHGWHDAVLTNVLSPAERLGQPDPLSAGMITGALDQTIVIPLNDEAALDAVMREHGRQIAAVILEPINHTAGCILPQPGYLRLARDLADRYGVVLIFDEIITGFRHDLGGYQRIAGITPDLTTMGKAVANGYPLALVAGRADLLEQCRPGGPVFFAGTYNAHPLCLAAAHATLDVLEQPGVYERLFALGDRMRMGLQAIFLRYAITATVAGFGSVFLTYFQPPPIETYADLVQHDSARATAFLRSLIAHGVFTLPLPLKRSYLSLAHTEADIDATLESVEAIVSQADWWRAMG